MKRNTPALREKVAEVRGTLPRLPLSLTADNIIDLVSHSQQALMLAENAPY